MLLSLSDNLPELGSLFIHLLLVSQQEIKNLTPIALNRLEIIDESQRLVGIRIYPLFWIRHFCDFLMYQFQSPTVILDGWVGVS